MWSHDVHLVVSLAKSTLFCTQSVRCNNGCPLYLWGNIAWLLALCVFAIFEEMNMTLWRSRDDLRIPSIASDNSYHPRKLLSCVLTPKSYTGPANFISLWAFFIGGQTNSPKMNISTSFLSISWILKSKLLFHCHRPFEGYQRDLSFLGHDILVGRSFTPVD